MLALALSAARCWISPAGMSNSDGSTRCGQQSSVLLGRSRRIGCAVAQRGRRCRIVTPHALLLREPALIASPKGTALVLPPVDRFKHGCSVAGRGASMTVCLTPISARNTAQLSRDTDGWHFGGGGGERNADHHQTNTLTDAHLTMALVVEAGMPAGCALVGPIVNAAALVHVRRGAQSSCAAAGSPSSVLSFTVGYECVLSPSSGRGLPTLPTGVRSPIGSCACDARRDRRLWRRRLGQAI
jgi:hypothetical protein